MLRPAEIVGAEMAATREGAAVFSLPSGIASKDVFFDSARSVFPMNPPLARDHENWDALTDSLRGGLDDLDARQVVIVWPDPWLLAEFDAEAGRIATEILSRLPEDLAPTHALTTILGTPGV
jgi:hypothetical protein